MKQLGGPAITAALAGFEPIGRGELHGGHKSATLGVGLLVLGAPNGARFVLVQAWAQNVRYTLDGTLPTATGGFQMVAGDPLLMIPCSTATTLTFCREVAGAVLEYIFVR